jgi:HK97 gp10 family phage protein
MASDKPIDLQVKGLEDVSNRFKKAPLIVATRLETALVASSLIAQRDIRKETPVDRNRLRNSILIQRLGRFALSVGTNVKYSIYVHEGTRPHRAPYGPIAQWARRRGIPAYPVWLSIMRKGTKPNPFFKRGVTAAEPAVINQFEYAGRLIAKDMGG